MALSLAVSIRIIDCANLSFVSPSCFSDVLLSDRCSTMLKNRLRADGNTSILSFSIDTDINSANVLRLGNVSSTQIRGFVNTGIQTYKTLVEEWLHHEDITNLELTAISTWHNKETIMKFLAESTLEGDGERQGQRLRIDMCQASGAPKACRGGRPSKRIASGASAGSTDSTPAQTPHATSAPSAAPLRVSLRTRIQIFVCGPCAQMNQEAAAGAVELLDSLTSREFRLLVVQGHG